MSQKGITLLRTRWTAFWQQFLIEVRQHVNQTMRVVEGGSLADLGVPHLNWVPKPRTTRQERPIQKEELVCARAVHWMLSLSRGEGGATMPEGETHESG